MNAADIRKRATLNRNCGLLLDADMIDALADAVEAKERIANRVVQLVCELPDHNSPDDSPETLLVTCAELKSAVLMAFEADEALARVEALKP